MLAFMLAGQLWADHRDALSIWMTILNESDRQEVLDYAHSKGAKILVSLGGGTDHIDTAGGAILAGKGAEYADIGVQAVLDYGLDGLDFDLELSPGNSQPFKSGAMHIFMNQALQTARQRLPKPYVISHAPMGPYASTWAGSDRGYIKWMLENQDNVDFISVQYYNQNDYYTYETTFKQSTMYPGSSVKELIEAGIHPEKVVVGKPLTANDASNGIIDVNTLAAWGCQAYEEIGFVGGYMTWMFRNDNVAASASWAAALNAPCVGAAVPENRCGDKTEEPVTEEPETEEPETDKPDNEEPETQEPENEEPDNEKPENEEPETQEPDNEEPDNEESENEEPETEEPETEESESCSAPPAKKQLLSPEGKIHVSEENCITLSSNRKAFTISDCSSATVFGIYNDNNIYTPELQQGNKCLNVLNAKKGVVKNPMHKINWIKCKDSFEQMFKYEGGQIRYVKDDSYCVGVYEDELVLRMCGSLSDGADRYFGL